MTVEPLALLVHADRPALSELMASEAVVLFADRAQEVRADFAISEGNALGVAEICRRVDGLPLAVELAAARIAHLPLPALLARLERCLPLLTGGARDLPERQRTLKGTITWSHDLLTLDEQILFRRLAVFLGGFTLEAAAAVAHAPIDLALDVFDGITTLVANSLLRQLEDANGAPRYVMLETIREYGLERLVESGEEEAVRREHAAFFMVFSEFGKTSPDWPGDLTWLTALEQEEANLRTALAWAVSRSEAEIGLRLIAAVGGSWDVRGRLREERSWLEQVLAISEGAASERRLVVSIRLAWNAFLLGDEVAARVIAEQSLTDARSLGDEGHAANALHVLGTLAGDRQEFDRAELLLAEAELLMRRNDDRCALAWILNHAGVMAAVQGDFERAMTCYEESLGLWRDLGNTWGLAHLQFNLAWLVRNQGDAKRAAELDREALIAFWKLKAESGLSFILGDAAELVLKAGDATRAARLGGASAHLRERTGTVVQAVSMVEYEHYVNATRANLGEAAFAAAWAAGEALTLSEAVTEAEAVFIAISNTTASPSVPPPLGLSPREREVLRLIAAGRSNRDIADALYISLPTAKVHVRSILTKLNLDSRTAAAAFAIHHDLA
jgi:non-specific serine/threonine protein kinase